MTDWRVAPEEFLRITLEELRWLVMYQRVLIFVTGVVCFLGGVVGRDVVSILASLLGP